MNVVSLHMHVCAITCIYNRIDYVHADYYSSTQYALFPAAYPGISVSDTCAPYILCHAYLERVQYVSPVMAHGAKDVEDGALGLHSWLVKRSRLLWQAGTAQEHRYGFSARVGWDFLKHLDRVVRQEVVQHQLPGVSKHAVGEEMADYMRMHVDIEVYKVFIRRCWHAGGCC